MVKIQKLYEKAKTLPANLKFSELCQLAEKAGFEFRNQTGSHSVYKHPELKEMMNFQPDGNKAKPYQVKQLLRTIDKYGLIKE